MSKHLLKHIPLHFDLKIYRKVYLRKISWACSILVGTLGASSFSHKIFKRFNIFSFDSMIPTRNQNIPSGKCYIYITRTSTIKWSYVPFEITIFRGCQRIQHQILIHTFRVIFWSLTASAANTDFPATGIPCSTKKLLGSSFSKRSFIVVS